MSNIKNVSDFINQLKGLGEPEKGYTRFFRGHSNVAYKLEPSIYRQPHLIQNEDKIIKDAFTFCSDFFEPHETLFEKLVKLQHYGYATRLLDISSNALVALYFSVLGNIDKDDKPKPKKRRTNGEVIVFDIPDNEIKYYDSDKVSILSALTLRKYDFKTISYPMPSSAHEILETLICSKKAIEETNILKILSKKKENKEIIDDCLSQLGITFAEFISQRINKERIDFSYRLFNEQPEIARLLHDIRKDKPSFLPVIEPDDLNKVICVRAKQNNPRISKQQGAFLIFGINQLKIVQADIPDSWIKSKKKLIVDKNSKENILKELQSFGISHQSLFPELDSQAKFIMDKYKE